MAGAPALAAQAALRGGAGLVDLAVPESVATIAAAFDPCVMTHSLPADGDGCFSSAAVDPLAALARRGDVLAVGPGIGRGGAVGAIVEELWSRFPGPAVFDADALWWLARRDPDFLAGHAGPRIITPHEGEMGRFLGDGSAAGRVPGRDVLEEWAARFAADWSVVILLKGPDTLVTDGERRARNTTGNPGMATGGAGDVLTGLLAALLRQPIAVEPPRLPDPFEAARIAAWVHGLAGDLAAADVGELSLTARDLLTHLPRALCSLVAGTA